MSRGAALLAATFGVVACRGGSTAERVTLRADECLPLVASSDSLVAIEPAFPALEFPLAPGSTTRRIGPMDVQLVREPESHYYVAARQGVVGRFPDDAETSVFESLLDISDRVDSGGDDGMLSLALDPAFGENGALYLLYVAVGEPRTIRLSRFGLLEGGPAFDPASEEILLEADKIPDVNSHSGGVVRFDAAGNLLASFGDGGFVREDPPDNAQDTTTLLGSVIRIRPRPDGGYDIPADNPFADSASERREIWAWGFRNPFRFSIDDATGDVWLGDVGFDTWEEINLVERGRNYGWPLAMGPDCRVDEATCAAASLREPHFSLRRDGSPESRAIVGGRIYRGDAIPELRGAYVFGDFSAKSLFALLDPTGEPELVELMTLAFGPTAFAVDGDGELLIVGLEMGDIVRLVPAGAAVAPRLSQTGCVDEDDPSALHEAFTPYDVHVPLWSDGLDKERYLALPRDGSVDVDAAGDLTPPVGSVLVKEFYAAGRRIETRFLVRRGEDTWVGYTYLWDDDGQDATLVTEPVEVSLDGLAWTVPGGQCSRCHTRAAGGSLGVDARQLSGPHGGFLDGLVEEGWLDDAALTHIEFPTLDDESEPLETRARAYLHANCAGCHRPGETLRVAIDLRFETPLAETGLCEPAELDALGLEAPRRVEAGAPERSVLLRRMSSTDTRRMPPLGTTLEDEDALEVVTRWITSLEDCPTE